MYELVLAFNQSEISDLALGSSGMTEMRLIVLHYGEKV